MRKRDNTDSENTVSTSPRSYEELYHALKSPRSTDPFMGMQLAAVKLPPSFTFNNIKNAHFRGTPDTSFRARFSEMN